MNDEQIHKIAEENLSLMAQYFDTATLIGVLCYMIARATVDGTPPLFSREEMKKHVLKNVEASINKGYRVKELTK